MGAFMKFVTATESRGKEKLGELYILTQNAVWKAGDLAWVNGNIFEVVEEGGSVGYISGPAMLYLQANHKKVIGTTDLEYQNKGAKTILNYVLKQMREAGTSFGGIEVECEMKKEYVDEQDAYGYDVWVPIIHEGNTLNCRIAYVEKKKSYKEIYTEFFKGHAHYCSFQEYLEMNYESPEPKNK